MPLISPNGLIAFSTSFLRCSPPFFNILFQSHFKDLSSESSKSPFDFSAVSEKSNGL